MIQVDKENNLTIVLPYKDYTFARELSVAIARTLQNQKEWDRCSQDDVYTLMDLLVEILPSDDEFMLLDNVAAGRKTVV